MLFQLSSWLQVEKLLTAESNKLIELMTKENLQTIQRIESINLEELEFSINDLNKECA